MRSVCNIWYVRATETKQRPVFYLIKTTITKTINKQNKKTTTIILLDAREVELKRHYCTPKI